MYVPERYPGKNLNSALEPEPRVKRRATPKFRRTGGSIQEASPGVLSRRRHAKNRATVPRTLRTKSTILLLKTALARTVDATACVPEKRCSFHWTGSAS